MVGLMGMQSDIVVGITQDTSYRSEVKMMFVNRKSICEKVSNWDNSFT